MRQGKEAIRWIQQQRPFVADQRLPQESEEKDPFAARLGLAAFPSSKHLNTSQASITEEASSRDVMVLAVKRLAAEASLLASILVYCGPIPDSSRESIHIYIYLCIYIYIYIYIYI